MIPAAARPRDATTPHARGPTGATERGRNPSRRGVKTPLPGGRGDEYDPESRSIDSGKGAGMRRAYIPVAAMLLFMLAPTAHAVATSFCVGTSAELQAALDQSATDGVDDVIKIRSGTYAPTTGSIAFAYFNSSDDTSLTISGGWSNLGMFNCIAQFGAPTATVLSGANARRVMRLQGDAGTSGALSVSNLTIRSGNASTDGGGLTLGDVAGFTGNLRVEQVYFDSNFATTFAAGALIATGGTIIVRNNWFRANECDSNYCAGEFVANFADKVDVRNSIGNNTIVANACGPGAPVTCVNSGFIVSGSARAAVFNNAF